MTRESTDLERRLDDALRERARLWEQVHEQRALEQEVEHLRAKVARMETSLSWRITKPIRLFKQRYDRVRKPPE